MSHEPRLSSESVAELSASSLTGGGRGFKNHLLSTCSLPGSDLTYWCGIVEQVRQDIGAVTPLAPGRILTWLSAGFTVDVPRRERTRVVNTKWGESSITFKGQTRAAHNGPESPGFWLVLNNKSGKKWDFLGGWVGLWGDWGKMKSVKWRDPQKKKDFFFSLPAWRILCYSVLGAPAVCISNTNSFSAKVLIFSPKGTWKKKQPVGVYWGDGNKWREHCWAGNSPQFYTLSLTSCFKFSLVTAEVFKYICRIKMKVKFKKGKANN